jgi:isopenicillin N synthase-like dioxygenase
MKEEYLNSIPGIDLGAFMNGDASKRQSIAQEVDEICREIGFLIIENHGVDSDVISRAWDIAETFFTYPDTLKIEAKSGDPGCPRGYTPLEGESLAKTRGVETPPDLKETFSSGPLSPPAGHVPNADFHFFYGPNIWPTEPAEFQKVWTDYYLAMEALGSRIMSMLAAALGVDDDFFVSYHIHHTSALRCQNYPKTDKPPSPGQLRAGAHTDYGSVTILKPDPAVTGLEVKSPSGNWIKAPLVKDGFIINIGDLLSHWTNDRWVSTMHRVVEPEQGGAYAGAKRQSIAYFMNPNYDAVIKTIPTCLDDNGKSAYGSVLAGDYLMKKFKQSI